MNILEINIKQELWQYFLLAILGSIIIRLILTLFTTLEVAVIKEKKFINTFYLFFIGKGIDDNQTYDYFQTLILGTMEISIYAMLLIANKPEFIGGWLVLKTLPLWNRWTEKRWIYNKFLLGNALVIIISYFLARWSF